MAAWHKELTIALLLFVLVIIIGGITGWVLQLTLLLVSGLLIHQLIQIHRFEKWLGKMPGGAYPKATGIWEEIYYHVYRMRKNNKKRKKKLSKMIDQFRQSTEALPDAAVVLGKNDEIEWTNKAAREVFGVNALYNVQAAKDAAYTLYNVVPVYPEALVKQPIITAQDVYEVDNRKSITGVAMFDKMDFEYSKQGDDTNLISFRLPDSTIIHPNRTKRKVITELNGRSAAVTEITSNGVWKLRIYGFIINAEMIGGQFVESNTYPLEKVKAMAEVFEVGSSMRVISKLCAA